MQNRQDSYTSQILNFAPPLPTSLHRLAINLVWQDCSSLANVILTGATCHYCATRAALVVLRYQKYRKLHDTGTVKNCYRGVAVVVVVVVEMNVIYVALSHCCCRTTVQCQQQAVCNSQYMVTDQH